MKKLFFAAAIAALSTVASAQVSINGKISIWQDRTTVGTSATNSMWYEPTSNIAFGAQETFGSGFVGRAIVETSIYNNTIDGNGTKLGDRQAIVGLVSKIASIDLGRNVHSQFLAVTNNDAFGTLYGSIAGDVHNLRGLRFGDAAFISITAIPGVTVNYDHSDSVGITSRAASVSGSYGPVNAVLAKYEQNDESSTVIGLNGKLKNTTVYYSHSDNKGAVSFTGDLISVRHQIGQFAAKASYGETSQDLKAYNLGVDYSLGKRTEVGVAYRNVDLLASSNDVKQIGIGFTHRF